MKIKGNFTLLYAIEILTGLSLWFAAQKWDLRGLVIVLFLYLIIMLITIIGHKADERELQLSHKINSCETIGAGMIAASIYLFFLEINWFFALVSSVVLLRGVCGLLMFSLR